MRILILRLSPQVLQDLIRSIWPMLLALLMQIFSRKQNNIGKTPNLPYAALKLIELISVIQTEEFYLHQWIFLFDCNPICLTFSFWDENQKT